jgi:tripartite-type tricarboxylate transporter receptor subunit TctC
MKKQLKIVAALSALFLLTGLENAFAQTNFYEGKTIRIIVGFSAGGGYDIYSRTIARHLGKHIPGHPAVTVENMTGAGSMIAANFVYRAAKPDGLTIGHFIGGLFLQQLLDRPGIEFDALKFEYIGVPAQDNFVLFLAKNSGIADVEKWLASKTLIKFGGVASGSGTNDFPNVLKTTIGLPIQLVSGYKGTADIRLALNAGEVQGLSNSWESTKSTWRKELENGDINVVLQANTKSHPELTQVPVAINLAKSEEAKKLIQTVVQVHGPSVRPYVLPPATPKDRVQILRKAFLDTMKDQGFLAEAKKASLDINPDGGAELEQNVKAIFKLDQRLIAKLKDILK